MLLPQTKLKQHLITLSNDIAKIPADNNKYKLFRRGQRIHEMLEIRSKTFVNLSMYVRAKSLMVSKDAIEIQCNCVIIYL